MLKLLADEINEGTPTLRMGLLKKWGKNLKI
jgi:hypothetical protein